jgi:hypothetical protein
MRTSLPAHLAAAFLVLMGTAVAGSAQERPRDHTWRTQAAWLDAREPAVMVAVETRAPLGGPGLLPGEGSAEGPVIIGTGDWLLSGMFAGGVTFAETSGRHVSLTATGQLGVMRRLDGKVDRVGLFAFGGLSPEAAGPVLRAEMKDTAGLQAGWVWFLEEGRGNGIVVSLDVSIALLRSLRM